MKYIINWKKDVVVERFAASSKGGQNANKTEVNVRLTHLPTGIKAQATSERSLDHNFNCAVRVLVARIIEHLESLKEPKAPKKSATRGNQRRTYYLNERRKLQLVVDHELEVELTDPKVMDGNLDLFIEAALRSSI